MTYTSIFAISLIHTTNKIFKFNIIPKVGKKKEKTKQTKSRKRNIFRVIENLYKNSNWKVQISLKNGHCLSSDR